MRERHSAIVFTLAAAISLLVGLVAADETDWVAWQMLPRPQTGSQAVTVGSLAFLMGGMKADPNDHTNSVPVTDVLYIDVDDQFSWNTVGGSAKLTKGITGTSFARAIRRVGKLYSSKVYPVFVSHACGRADVVSSTVDVIHIDVSNSRAVTGSTKSHRNQIARRLASLGIHSTVENVTGPISEIRQRTTLYLFGGVNNRDQFVSIVEKVEVVVDPEAKYVWEPIRPAKAQMPREWCECSVVETPEFLLLSGCTECDTGKPTVGSLRFFTNNETWFVDAPTNEQAVLDAKLGSLTPQERIKFERLAGLCEETGCLSSSNYTHYWPAMENTQLGSLMNFFVGAYANVPNSPKGPAIILYDNALNQQNIILTTSISSRRSNPAVFSVGAWYYAAGGFIDNTSTVTADADKVNVFPQVMVDIDHDDGKYYSGESVKVFAGSACSEGSNAGSSRMMLSIGPECRYQLPGTDIQTCDGGFNKGTVFDMSNVTVPGGVEVEAYLCHTWGTCAYNESKRKPCPNIGRYTEDDCRWQFCCWDNEAQECYTYGNIEDSTAPIYWNPVTIGVSNLHPLLPIRISNKAAPASGKSASWLQEAPFIVSVSCAGVLLVAIAGAVVFLQRQRKINQEREGIPSNVFVAFGKEYALLKQIGQGGYGTVFLAERDEQQVALKCIPYTSSQQRDAAIREYDTIHRLTHRNLIQTYELIVNWDAESKGRSRRSTLSVVNQSERMDSPLLNADQTDHPHYSEDENRYHQDSGDSGESLSTNPPLSPNKSPPSGEYPTQRLLDSVQKKGSNIGSSSSITLESSDSPNSNYLGPLKQFSSMRSFVCLVCEYVPLGDLSGYIERFQDTPRLPKKLLAELLEEEEGAEGSGQLTLNTLNRLQQLHDPPKSNEDQLDVVRRDESGKWMVPETFILSVGEQLCSLLQHLHSQTPPVVHRDLKPENILLDGNRIVVTDFGLAHMSEEEYMNTRVGTLFFAAPEVLNRKYTTAVDLWSTGCVLYALATQRVAAESARIMFSDVDDEDFEAQIRHDLRFYSEALQDTILALLSKEPNKRPCAVTAFRRLQAARRQLVKEPTTSTSQ